MIVALTSYRLLGDHECFQLFAQVWTPRSQLDVLSNNIANAKTTGYKRSDASFQDIYAEKTNFLAPGQIGHGASLDTIRQFRSQMR